jgi:hypothetical protein
MTIRADSYGSAAEVIAFTKHLLDGQSTFNSTTRPTGDEVEKFIDRASSYLNVSLSTAGLQSPVTNSTAKLICDDWVVQLASEYVELTQRGVGYNQEEGARYSLFSNLRKKADEFVGENRLGLARLGVTVTHELSEGLSFTGLTAQADRTDPTDTSKEQPFFSRKQFDNPEEG